MEEWMKSLCDSLPRSQAYPTVAALHQHFTGLAQRHGNACELSRLGRSRDGEPIQCMRIGDGPFQALLVGLPHPDEPIGSLMLMHLAQCLASDDTLRQSLQYTWYIVPAADPDGSRLNQGWYGGPFEPGFFGRHYYRPVERDQFEWTFPIQYKRLRFDSPNPEAAAVAALIDRVPLDYLANLHNCTVGGGYLYLSHAAPPLYQPFYDTLNSAAVFAHRGQPEVPYLRSLDGDAVFAAYGSRQVYDFYESTGHADPTKFIDAGTCTDDYVLERWDAFTLACELPYFTHAAVASRRLLQRSRLQVLEDSWQCERPHVDWVVGLVSKQRLGDGPLQRVIQYYVDTYAGHRQSELEAARRNPAYQQAATEAEEADARIMRGYDHLFLLGQLGRATHASAVWERYDEYMADLPVVQGLQPDALARAMLEMCLRGAMYARDEHRGGKPISRSK